MDYLKHLQEAYSRNLLIPVVGSGISIPFGLPDWKTLIEKAAQHFKIRDQYYRKVCEYLELPDYLKAVDELIAAGVPEYELQMFVAQYLSACKQACDTEKIQNNYLDLTRMKLTRFVTTNYDQYLNDYTGGDSFYLEELENIPVNTFQMKQYDNSIIPIHGELDRPERIVLSRNSYDRLYGNSNFHHEFRYIREYYTFLFMGFSFEDVYFKNLFEKILNRRFSSRHFILFDKSEQIRNQDKILELRDEYGVEAIFYDSRVCGHTEEIHRFLKKIIDYHDADVDLSDMPRLEIPKTGEKINEDIFTQAQIFWNKKMFKQAKEILDKYTGLEEKRYRLLSDICEASDWRWPNVPENAEKLLVYDEKPWSDEYSAQVRNKYLELRDKYVNSDTFNLKGLKEYKTGYDQEAAYYWLGVAAGQIFHEHSDAIQYLLRANELNPSVGCQQQLGLNYLENARQAIRYRKNMKAYDLDRSSLEKAVICFRYAMQTRNEEQLRSSYKICGEAYLECLYLMHHDYEFEQFWENAHEDLPMNHKVLLYKAEVDARFLYKILDEHLCGLTKGEKLYVELVKEMSLAKFYGNMGITEKYSQHYQNIINKLEAVCDDKKTTLECALESGNFQIMDIALDSALFVGNVPLYEKYYEFSIQYRGTDPVLMGFMEELKGNIIKAEEIYSNFYRLHPDISTFSILNSFYLRTGLKGHLEMHEKSIRIREEIISGHGATLVDAASFYETYILEQLQYGNGIDKAITLYIRFYKDFLNNPEIHFEIEEILKPFLYDYDDLYSRCEWNRKMLTKSPKQLHQQYYRNMLRLYISNCMLDRAQCLWTEIIQDLEMSYPERTSEYQFLQIIDGKKRGDTNRGNINGTIYVKYIMEDVKRLAGNDLFNRKYFGCGEKQIILPMRAILAMLFLQRLPELKSMRQIFIPYSSVCFLQQDLCIFENPIVRIALEWIKNAENVVLFAPRFKSICERMISQSGETFERMQIELYEAEHLETELLFRDMLQS